MATRGKGKTYEEILAEENATGKKTYDEAAAKTKETAAQKISNQNAVIDSAAQNTTAQYQKTIDESSKRFAGQYDDNYIDELVARKNLENSMADMGLTDSGLNRSQQTAISVMRGNADAKTRQQQQDFISAVQQAIDQVLAEAERDKASYANEINTGVEDYLAQLWTTVQQNAQANATSRYNTQEESLDAAYKAQLEAEAEAEKRAQEWAKALLSQGYIVDNDGNVVALPLKITELQNSMIQTLVKEGMSYEDAYKTVVGTALQTEPPAVDDASTTDVATTNTPATNTDVIGVISGRYKTIKSWAEYNLAKGLKSGTISKESAAKSLYAQVIATYGVDPHEKRKLTIPETREQIRQDIEDAQKCESALVALWNTAYDLGIEDEMAELCEVSLGDISTRYTGGRIKTTSSGTASSKGTKPPASSEKDDDGGLIGWFKRFVSDYNME